MSSTTRDRFVWDVEELDPENLGRFGGKGAGLARMMKAGIPVPPGFVIGTDAFRVYHAGGAITAALEAEIDDALARLESRVGKRFGVGGETDEPLLVSVRSGAPVSMPGMMDTVLNLGLDAARANAFADAMNNVPFALDTWLRFWRMFAEIVLGVDAAESELELESDVAAARSAALADPTRASFAALEGAVTAALLRTGAKVVTAPRAQLSCAISAVFRSWDSRRAKTYRANQGIAENLGTAVTIQAMVFGNRDGESGSGVAFSCNPNTGARGLFGEYVRGRQGEDLVSGTATPIDLSRPDALSPTLREGLLVHARDLEVLYRDAVDIEFTVESNRLYLLQVRPAKRTAEAAVRIAVDLLNAQAITREEAVRRVTPEQLGKLLRPTFDPAALAAAPVLTAGIGSSPGHASGSVVLTSDEAAAGAERGERVILLRPTTSPQDIRGMLAADAIITARGGALSHAAVVSRALDKPCIVGCEAIDVDVAGGSFTVDGRMLGAGTTVSVDGTTGRIYLADIPLRPAATGRAQLTELLEASRAISHAEIAVSVFDFADVVRATGSRRAGIVVGLTDLLIAGGDIEDLTGAIGDLEDDARASAAELKIESLARRVAERVLAAAPDAPIAFRLPSFLSERARQIVPTWAALPARSLLPLGQQRFYAPIARGVIQAARGDARVALLLSGVTEPAEVEAFRRIVADANLPRTGAVARSFAALHNFAATRTESLEMWVDIDAVVRSAYGFPSELMSAPGVFSDYARRGFLTTDPQQVPAPFLLTALAALLARIGPDHVGVLFAADAEKAMLKALYALGFRRFCVPVNNREQVALLLARAAIGVPT
jgi:pyruvate,orthophosphate dikinase